MLTVCLLILYCTVQSSTHCPKRSLHYYFAKVLNILSIDSILYTVYIDCIQYILYFGFIPVNKQGQRSFYRYEDFFSSLVAKKSMQGG
jgi:hypothetical protein